MARAAIVRTHSLAPRTCPIRSGPIGALIVHAHSLSDRRWITYSMPLYCTVHSRLSLEVCESRPSRCTTYAVNGSVDSL